MAESLGTPQGTRAPTALVTGGAGGIGRAVCAALAEAGAEVIVCDLDEHRAREVARTLPAGRAVGIDLGDRSRVEAGVARIRGIAPHVDVLVHNAGIGVLGPFAESDPADWDLMWRVNTRAPMLLTRAFLPGMIARGRGRLVFVSSDGARAGAGGEGAYAATKSALFGLAKTLARETARYGVTSNVVCPGPTDTPMLREVGARHPGLVAELTRRIPAGRLGTPADVAAAVAFLASPSAAYITGQTLSVSGGITMQ
ncbi:2-hydroxycyclohexanecarboxyl-CoA dehydrogenase [Nocardiopsis mwathae]|uniref:2-hydroxycyclohexanecarboxyl-CoA dehydrogenase n=1 Tax=Nocardiopsis mwathae TaxID=1472723 RepID=A0A7W9YIV1_9ACTN|nr:SDR family oxidoreductase [Nocardiopsis mwathae]MBB6172933.1 2-hydroxycyclohexanecarboxyl-CoA dehydrogenase [Nocardiopsis mwathae]